MARAWTPGSPMAARVEAARQKAETMAALYRAGYTLQQIGNQYGVTRERVRQLMTKHCGLRWRDGGNHVRSMRRQKQARADHDAKYLTKYGCTFDQWRELRRIGDEMRAAGAGRYQAPLYAFANQRKNAAQRGIGWELTLWQWWTIWQQSGHWEQRGRGPGYVMCRKGDTGPYAIGNVFIALNIQNVSEGRHKKSDLPIGVVQKGPARYEARRSIAGKVRYLGIYPTPDIAHAAYLRAGQRAEAA